MPYYGYWGKRKGAVTHENVYHAIDSAAVAKAYLESVPSVASRLSIGLGVKHEEVVPLVTFLVGCHDLGKFCSKFQRRHLTGDSVDHDTLTFQVLEYLWPALEEKDVLRLGRSKRGRRSSQKGVMQLMRSVSGHHGVPPEDVYNHMISELFSPDDLSMIRCFLVDLAEVVFEDGLKINLPERFSRKAQRGSWLLAGFAVMCDWIASDEDHFGFYSARMDLGQYWHRKALPSAKSAIQASGILPTPVASPGSFKDLFEYVKKDPTPLQKHAMDCKIHSGPNLMILEDMTGAGKTEAACILAARMMEQGMGEGMFVALPTMATADGIYGRVGEFYPKMFKGGSYPSLVLSHGSNRLSEKFERSVLGLSKNRSCTSWIADNRKKAFLADVGVGTIDQALMGILPARHQSLRLFGMAKHILVVDEVHSHDPYMHGLLRTLLKFHAAQGGSAILLSATLPAKMRSELVDSYREGLGYDKESTRLKLLNSYPLFTAAGINHITEIPVPAHVARKRQVTVEQLNWQDQVVKELVSTVSAGQCGCWIRNTVTDVLHAKTSIEAALEKNGISLTMPNGEDRVILFHARFAMGDRLEIEDRVTKYFGPKSTEILRSGRILVASQVVEQSLDLDFDKLVSDLAPMDSLIQRAGRSRRHIRDAHGNRKTSGTDERGPAKMIVYGPDPERVYTKTSDSEVAQWYEDCFAGGAMVYQSHSHLWLTSLMLKRRGGWKMPEDARTLMEGSQVYSPSHPIPDLLFLRDADAEEEKLQYATTAKHNSLRLESGYVASQASWRNREESAPTRLGMPSTTILLAKWDGHKLEPWFKHDRHPIEMSQLRVLEQKVCSPTWLGNSQIEKAVEELSKKYNKPDLKDYVVIVPVIEGGDGDWHGTALDVYGAERHLRYNPSRGLSIPSNGKKQAEAA